MSFWGCARLELRREAVAQHFLKLNGSARARTAAQARQAHRNHFAFVSGLRFHRDRAAMAPGALERRRGGSDYGWRAPSASTRSGYRRASSARSPRRSRASEVIRAQARGSRENPRWAISSHLALYAGMKSRQRVEVMLALLGGQQRVILPRAHVEALAAS